MTTVDAPRRAPRPRFGGLLWRIVRHTNTLMVPLAGKTWNPLFAVVIHRGRRSGRAYATPVAARRIRDGFVISLSFGAQVDWYRNLVSAGGGIVGWRGREFSVSAPEVIDPTVGLEAFHPVQRFFLRLGRIDGFVHLDDAGAGSRW
jgi:deazaflavin-dependent oxidoreductase (nitroreductase family)